MTAELSDVQQRVSNLMRVGKIVSVDHATGRARVRFGDNTTAPLPWMAGRAGGVKEWSPPAVGEQVVVMSPSGEIGAGVIMPGGIYTTGNAAPGNAGNKYALELPAGGEWELRVGAGKIKLTESAATITIGGVVLSFSGGTLSVQGEITATGDITAGSVSLQNHTHGGVEPGGGVTGTPI